MLSPFKNKKIRTWGVILIVVIAAVVAVRAFSPANASDTAAIPEGEVVPVTIAETIEASGSMAAQPFAALSWKTSGVVEQVNVMPGDQVRKGDILLALQPESTSSSIVAAQADLINAQESLKDLLSSGTSLAQAAIDLREAQEAYDDAVYYLKYLQTDEKVPQTNYTAKLVQTRDGWKYQYDTDNFKGPAPKEWIIDAQNDLALKEGQLQDAQREYDRLFAGEASSDVLAAQANVEAAQTTVNTLYIIAPFDGEVLSVSNHVGDSVTTDELSVNLADLDQLYVETQVDESDVANVKVGNQVTADLDAVPGITLTGEVTEINPVGEVVSGLVKYTVRVDLDPTDGNVFLPLGSTVNVVIQIQDPTEMLAVPITAIQNDSRGEYVWVIRAEQPVRVDVVGGTIVEDLVTVTGDLQKGEHVQLLQSGGFEAPNPFQGGNE